MKKSRSNKSRIWLGLILLALVAGWALFTPGLVTAGDQEPVPPDHVSPDTSACVSMPLPDTTESIMPQPDDPTATGTDLSVWDVLWLMLTL